MQVIINWKNFKDEKPKINVPIIVKGMRLTNPKKLWFGKYLGPSTPEITNNKRSVFDFIGKELSTKSLLFEQVCSCPIYPPEDFDPKLNFDPYDFLWDYYEPDWLKDAILKI